MDGQSLAQGAVLADKYKILDVIGRGGFGITYLAECSWSRERVAVKELFWAGHMRRAADGAALEAADPAEQADADGLCERFLREARTLYEFRDEPGVVRIEDYFRENGTAYIVMEYLSGETLEQRVRRAGPMDPAELCRMLRGALSSLSRMHAAGWVHRDISPENLMLLPDGRIKLLDFGAVRRYGEQLRRNSYYQKSSYSPPEQYSAEGRLGPWTDVYAICATIYRCVTGVRPPDSLARGYKDDLPAPSSLNSAVTPALERALLRGLALEPERRFRSVDELAAALEKSADPSSRRRRARRRAAAALAAVLLALGAALGVYFARRAADPLSGVEAGEFYLFPWAELSDGELYEAREALAAQLEELTGGAYELRELDGGLYFRVPDSAVPEGDGFAMLDALLTGAQLQQNFGARYLPDVSWDPAARYGGNQCPPGELSGETVMVVFSVSEVEAENLDASFEAELDTVIKARLDSLGAPYAYGTLSNGDKALRISTGRMNAVVQRSLFDQPYIEIRGEYAQENDLLDMAPAQGSLETLEYGGGYAVRYSGAESFFSTGVEPFVESAGRYGLTEVYLSFQNFLMSTPIFAGSLDAQPEAGALYFDRLALEGFPEIDGDSLWLCDFACVCVNTDIQSLGLGAGVYAREAVYFGADGEPQLSVYPAERYAMQFVPEVFPSAAEELAGQINETSPYRAEAHEGLLFIEMGLPKDLELLSAGLEGAAQLAADFDLLHSGCSVYILLTDVAGPVSYQTGQTMWVIRDGLFISLGQMRADGTAGAGFTVFSVPISDEAASRLAALWDALELPEGYVKEDAWIAGEDSLSALNFDGVVY